MGEFYLMCCIVQNEHYFVVNKKNNEVNFKGASTLEELKKDTVRSLDYNDFIWVASNAIFYIQYKPFICRFKNFDTVKNFLIDESLFSIGKYHGLKINNKFLRLLSAHIVWRYKPYKEK